MGDVMKVFVLGIDGLTFDILDPLIEQGLLPNFKRLKSEGAYGRLESVIPPSSPPAWNTIATGLSPEEHGIKDFWTFQWRNNSVERTVGTRRKAGKAIWQTLNEYGKQVIVVNVPMTFPPDPVNGIMVSGLLTPSTDSPFTYPNEFREELFKAVPDYLIDLRGPGVWGDRGAYVEEIVYVEQKRMELLKYLLNNKPWDFFFFVFTGTDRLQHGLWDEIQKMEPRAVRLYSLLDSVLALVMDHLQPEDILLVLSDHGFRGIYRTFNVNEFLRRSGLLHLKKGAYFTALKGDLRRGALRTALVRTGLETPIRKMRQRIFARSKKTSASMAIVDRVDTAFDPSLVDWSRTDAAMLSFNELECTGIWCRNAQVADRVATLLQEVVDPKKGVSPVAEVEVKQDSGNGQWYVWVWMANGYGPSMMTAALSLFTDSVPPTGNHAVDGVLIAWGPQAIRSGEVQGARIYDIVPTIMYSMDLPIDSDLHGRVLTGLFRFSRSIRVRDVKTGAITTVGRDTGSLVADKLRHLLGE